MRDKIYKIIQSYYPFGCTAAKIHEELNKNHWSQKLGGGFWTALFEISLNSIWDELEEMEDENKIKKEIFYEYGRKRARWFSKEGKL